MGRENTLVLDSSISVKDAKEMIIKWHKLQYNLPTSSYDLMIDSSDDVLFFFNYLNFYYYFINN